LGRLEKYEIFYLHEQIDIWCEFQVGSLFPVSLFQVKPAPAQLRCFSQTLFIIVSSGFKILNTKKIKWIHLFSFFNSNIIKI